MFQPFKWQLSYILNSFFIIFSDKEGVECEECGKVLSNLVSLKKHDRRMHRHMLVEVPQIDQVNMNNKNFKTLKIESIEDGLKGSETERKVECLADEQLVMSGSDEDIGKVAWWIRPVI